MSGDSDVWLGLDIGTSSVKAIVITRSGLICGRASIALDLDRDLNGRAEQDPDSYVEAVAEAIAVSGVSPSRVAGIGLVGQTPTLVVTDERGIPIRPAMTWQDQRPVDVASELGETLGNPVDIVGTSLPWSASALPAKLVWLAREEPAVMSRARWLLQPKDFVALTMTGVATSDPWSSKGLIHVGTEEPCSGVFELAQLSTDLVPSIRPAWHWAGAVTGSAAQRFGLSPGTAVTVGWSDALGGMLAAGAFDEGTAFVLSGTSNIVGRTSSAGPVDAWPLYSVPTSCAPAAVTYGPTSTAGAALVWLASVAGISVAELVDSTSRLQDPYDVPLFLPYLDGERAPLWRSDIGAAFTGIRAHHALPALAQAVITGVVCSERHVLDTASRLLGSDYSTVRTSGVGATQPVWLRARANLFGERVHAFEEPSLTAVGACMLAAMAEGSGDPAVTRALRPAVAISVPRPDEQPAASSYYERYLMESEHACLPTK